MYHSDKNPIKRPRLVCETVWKISPSSTARVSSVDTRRSRIAFNKRTTAAAVKNIVSNGAVSPEHRSTIRRRVCTSTAGICMVFQSRAVSKRAKTRRRPPPHVVRSCFSRPTSGSRTRPRRFLLRLRDPRLLSRPRTSARARERNVPRRRRCVYKQQQTVTLYDVVGYNDDDSMVVNHVPRTETFRNGFDNVDFVDFFFFFF